MAIEQLTTVSEVKAELDISGSTYDTLLGELLDQAECLLADWVGRRKTDGGGGVRWSDDSTNIVEAFPGAMQRKVLLRNFPINSIQSVKVYSSSTASYTMTSTLYRVDTDLRTLRFLGSRATAWEAGLLPSTVAPMNPVLQRPILTSEAYPYLEVTYRGGYQTNRSDVPFALAAAAIAVTKQLWFDRKKDRTVQSETLGKHSVSFGALSPSFVEYIKTTYLTPYISQAVL